MRYRAVLLIALFALPGAASEAGGDLRKAKAYVSEVRKHLLQSYLEREKLTAAKLTAAGLKALAQGLADLPEARAAMDDEETIDGALEAVARAAPAVDVNALADHAARAMVAQTGDPFCRILTQEDMTKLVKMIGGGGGKDVTAGVMVQPREDGLAVMYVQACTPADEEGIEIGDLITRANQLDTLGLTPEQAQDALKMRAGGMLALAVKRKGREVNFNLRAP